MDNVLYVFYEFSKETYYWKAYDVKDKKWFPIKCLTEFSLDALVDTYNGVLKFLNEEISSTFLPYEDKTAALKMYKFLVKYANDDNLLRRVIGNVGVYRGVGLAGLVLLGGILYRYFKMLPVFRLEKRVYLHVYVHIDREYVSPRCLLDSPFIWGDADKYRFLINLDYLLKREVFKLESFNDTLTTFAIANLGDWVHALYNKRVLYNVYYHSQKSYDFSRAAAVVEFCSNVFWHYNNYAIECRERKIGNIRIVRKLSEALPNLFIDLFDGCINHACNLEDLYQPKMHEAVFSMYTYENMNVGENSGLFFGLYPNRKCEQNSYALTQRQVEKD
ncbi:hypothetical protein PVK06_018817 [Gossypium arboreum]|uniref:Uncharacterized protein n=1 Tax=Gossypium arboreum TaxID=29729 RepID=A0ABR0PI79_GOSAR|nr:hypothetical protein PVK06_018817 [Gossypium arboreum]